MSLRDQALTDILAAASSDVLGQDIVIDGKPVSALVKELTAEELAQHGFDGISVEASRMTTSVSALGFIPERGREMDVDGTIWTAGPVSVNGDRLRITISRYIS